MKTSASTAADAAREARATAADLLWEARAEPVEQALDHTLWALCLVPGCRAARMLRIDLLIQSGDLDEARDALATESIRRPLSWSVAYRRARVQFLRDALDEARAEIRFVLRSRPHHAGALVLASQIAREAGRDNEALDLLERARTARPRDQRIVEAQAHMAIDNGQRGRATIALLELRPPRPALEGRLLALNGRRSDARELLEHAFDVSNDLLEQDELLTALIEMIDADGGVIPPLRWRLRRDHPKSILAYAAAILRRGHAVSALRLARWVARKADHRLEAMTLSAAAAQVVGDPHRSARAARSVQALARTPRKKRQVADMWRRAIACETIREIKLGRARSEQSPLGPLVAMIRESVQTLQDHLSRDCCANPAERAEYERQLRLGIAGLDVLESPDPAPTAHRAAA